MCVCFYQHYERVVGLCAGAVSVCQDTFEIQKDAIKEGQRVVIVDDLLATGGEM